MNVSIYNDHKIINKISQVHKDLLLSFDTLEDFFFETNTGSVDWFVECIAVTFTGLTE